MGIDTSKLNAIRLTAEMQWLAEVIDTRLKLYHKRESAYAGIQHVPAPAPADDTSLYGNVLGYYNMDLFERVILLLALTPHIMPHLLDVFFVKNADYDRAFTEYGGTRGQTHTGFIPTGETAAFILCGNNLEDRFYLLKIFGEGHFFRKSNILKLTHSNTDEPFLSGVINISEEYLSYFTHGQAHTPDFSMGFPAKKLDTKMDWADLILDAETLQEIDEIKDWLQYGDTLMTDLSLAKKLKPGYKTLFYGPPGTGKTLTAALLGKSAGLNVYRIDLSMVVSKYIGETEKNLEKVFAQAENKNWLLFFDEADALFGKRTQTSSANDRFANQEVSYLLQRMEEFAGVVVLATNIKANLDDAFGRRFQSVIQFKMPGPRERLLLWQQAFSGKLQPEPALLQKLGDVAAKYEIAGGAIINVIRYSAIQALKAGSNTIAYNSVLAGIRKEYLKEGKTI